MVLKPNQEKYFNLGLEMDSGIMIRALNLEKELKVIQMPQPVYTESV
jgi:hypothetical protein